MAAIRARLQMRAIVLLPLLGVASNALPSVGEAEAPSAKVPDAVTGTFRYAGGQSERKELARRIEQTVQGMRFYARPFARPRLKKGNQVHRKLTIVEREGVVTVRMNGYVYRAPLDGSWVKGKGSDGSDLRFRYRVDGDRLVQIFDAGEGRRVNHFVPTSEGGLQLRARVTSSHFDAPLTYELTYERP